MRVLVVVLPSGVLETDSDGVVEYVHVRPTAFVIASIAPRTSYTAHSVAWTGIASMSAQDLSNLAGFQGRE